jgi:hypothetical protein
MDFKASLIHYKYESNLWRENITSMEVEAFRDQLVSRLRRLEFELNERSLHLSVVKELEMQKQGRELNVRENGSKRQTQEGTVNNEGTLDDSLVFMGNNALSELQTESSTPGNDSDANGKLNPKDDLKTAPADVGPSHCSGILVKVNQSTDDVNIFDNVFAYETQSHVQLEYINDTYVVNQDDRNITPKTPHVDLNGCTVEHNSVNRDQECASTALMIKNMQNEVD